ncbi:MAG: histidine kinase [Acidobacteriota bacterium]
MTIEFSARRQLAPNFTQRFPSLEFSSTLFTFWAMVGVIYAFEYYRKYRLHELRASQLEIQLSQAQLQALRMQLNPHFLFNTLHAISSLMRRNVEEADRMIAHLSDLLRLSLEHTGQQEVPLNQELEFLKRYLEIEQTRFQERLRVCMEIAPETLDALVPNLILQPLVENAIRHGIAPRAAPGTVEVFARRQGETLEIQVQDNGCGLQHNDSSGLTEGVGLANTRARLIQLYGAAQHFELKNRTEGGVTVKLIIPFRQCSAQIEKGNR